jgi:hypothetical protein
MKTIKATNIEGDDIIISGPDKNGDFRISYDNVKENCVGATVIPKDVMVKILMAVVEKGY